MRDLLIESQFGAVRRVVMNRPEKLNALSNDLVDQLLNALDDAMDDPSIHVVVLSGAGRAFSAGGDITARMKARTEASMDSAQSGGLRDAPMDMVRARQRISERWLHIWALPKPIIAQVHGYCLGAANELAGACDLVVCGSSAQIGMHEARTFALPPTLGFWPLRIGVQRTKQLLFTGRMLSGDEAVDWGLAIASVPDDELESFVNAMAMDIAAVPARLLVVVKQACNNWAEASGVRTSALRGAEYHALFHQASRWEDAFRNNPSTSSSL